MDQQQPNRPRAHMTAGITTPTVKTIPGFPGIYAIRLSEELTVHATAAQWDYIDGFVRAGMAEHQSVTA